MSDLLRAGVDLDVALQLLSENARYRRVVDHLRKGVLEGTSLATSLRDAGVQGEVQAFIEAGEVTGALAQALALAAHYLERRRMVWEQVMKLGSYPALLVILTSLVMYLLAAIVIPSFAKMYTAMGIQEGTSLQWLFLFSRVVTVSALPVLGFVLVAGSGLYLARQRVRGALRAACMKVGYLRSFLQLVYSHRIFHLLAFLLQGGVDVLRAVTWLQHLDIASLGHRFQKVRASMEQGDSLVSAFQHISELTPVVFQMLSLAETTGDVVTATKQIYEYLERARVRRQEQIARIAEPMITLVLGGAVGLATLLLMMPMMQLISQLS
ncbi:MAG: type II secretion system F family protein [Firmicutes bacterium]|nr:type II secretion system F family protein [Bacillota bacterium]